MNAHRLTTERNRFIISGAVGLILLVALITLGIKASFGAFDHGYEVHGTFAAAGQGLLAGSDVKIRGVDIGQVSDIELVDNRARITLDIDEDAKIPVAAQAVIRPKTLFGEKFVDIIPGPTELDGPYLEPGGEIEDTLGGFELEQVLTDAYPVLEAVDPAELAVVLHELATGADGLGENINRSIVNSATLARLQASNDGEVRQFLSDLALLSEELDALSPDLVAAAKDLNVALPPLNERSDQLNAALVETARLSSGVADLLENNRDFTENALTNGSKTLQILFDNRNQIQPLLLGLQQYTQTIAEVIRIEVGDGTLMAAVKNLVAVPPPSDGGEPAPPPDGEPGLPTIPTVPTIPGVTVPSLDSSTSGDTSTSDSPLLDLLFPGDGG